MKLRVGSRVFAPSWFSIVLTLVLVPCLASLGAWQLRRADEKRELMTQAERGRYQTLGFTASNAGELARYQHVAVTGHYDSAQQILLDNMPSSKGQPGYRVLTPFIVSDQAGNQTAILVARGWLAADIDRAKLPTLSVSDDQRAITGLLDELPRPGVRAGDAGIQLDHWPQRLNYPTLTELQQLYGPALYSRILLLDADQPDGFERVWQIDVGFTPERHVGYAIQWFGLALTLLIIFVVVNLKRNKT